MQKEVNQKKHLRIGCLKNEEIEYSQVLWLINEQRNITNNNKIMTDLRGNLDGILCVKGRLENSGLPYSCKYPILLNRGSYLTELIILKCYLFVLYSGVKDTLNELKCNYWVTRGRQTIESAICKCLKCIRQSSRPFDVLPTAPLPRFRVDIDFPYSHSRVDYLGPLYVRNIYGNKNGDLYKCHILLYTCGSIRAVSLDTVPDASCQSFI